MTINLAKVVPWLIVIPILVFSFLSSASEGPPDDSPYDAYDGFSSGFDDTRAAEQYLDSVAVELAQPGVFVDPDVKAERITTEEAVELDRIAARTPGPVRVAVLPAAKLRKTSDEPAYGRAPLAWEAEELVAQLYDRVGVDGTYAVLVDASSSEAGRSFSAYQFDETEPFYDVEGALDSAIDCCAPDYAAMLARFLAETGDEPVNGWLVFGGIVGGLTALVGGGLGLRRWRRRREERRVDAEVAEALRPALEEEVIELSATVGALPALPADASVEAGADVRRVLDLIEESRHRLDEPERMDTPEEAEEITTRLADARYLLTRLEALREGRPVPERTAPCFIDPRHGPSASRRGFAPEGGKEREVPVCAACAEVLDRGEEPTVRTLRINGKVRLYWEAERFSRPYVNGYWQRERFPDQQVQRTRHLPARALAPTPAPREKMFTFVWESESTGGSGGGGWGGGGSSSRRSFGGGSSRRSSTRSGGSRRF